MSNTSKEQIEQLLNQVKLITERYEKHAELTGEKFNVFDIIGLRNSEVKMHSAMLNELLNAKGKHGMKDVFLNLFMHEIGINDFQINTENSNSRAEVYTGIVEDDKGGRIDIIIKDNENNAIIIENKIYADEQKNQLIRYYNHNQTAKILFLTLHGLPPNSIKFESEEKSLDISDKVISISYKEHILNWLVKCQKEVYDKPLILYSLKQYENLIKILTNQTINKEKIKDMTDVFFNNNYSINSYLDILKTSKAVSDEILLRIRKAIEVHFQNLTSPYCSKFNIVLNDGYDPKGLPSIRKVYDNCEVAIQFESDKRVFVGILIKDLKVFDFELYKKISKELNLSNESPETKEEKAITFELKSIKRTGNWYCGNYFDLQKDLFLFIKNRNIDNEQEQSELQNSPIIKAFTVYCKVISKI